jgi:hypothetical protein
MNKVLLLILIVTIISYIIDIKNNNCKHNNDKVKQYAFYLFLLIHHFVAAILYLGWLSNNKSFLLFYLIFLSLVLTDWCIDDLKCILTEIINTYCGNDEREPFHDLFYLIGLKRTNYYSPFIYLYLLFTFVISLVKIFYL